MNFQKMAGYDVDVPQIKLRPLDTLVHYARNSRTHSPAQIEQLQALLLEFGWTNAVLIDEQGIVAGHGRCMAAEAIYKRGDQIKFPNGTPIPIGMVPTMDCTGWSDAQRRAYIIADNQSAIAGSGWDEDLLRLELQELEASGFDLTLTAFSEDELAELLAPDAPEPGGGDPAAAPPLPDTPVCELGDVWLLGNHKLAVGDCTDASTWDRLMFGEIGQVAWLDPPYNVNQERKNREQDKWDGGSRVRGAIHNDKMPGEAFRDFLTAAFSSVFAVLKPGAPIYVSYADIEAEAFLSAFSEAGFKRQSILAWVKNVQTLGRTDHQSRTESLLYGWKPGARHPWYGGRKINNVLDLGADNPFKQLEDGRWQVQIGDTVMIVSGDIEVETHPTSAIHEPRPARSDLHPSMKPVSLVARTLRNSARAGDIVIDAFGGSGSTLIAAEQLGLFARIVEIDPGYADVILRRFWHYSGKRPVHAVTGEGFPDDREARATQSAAPEDSDLF